MADIRLRPRIRRTAACPPANVLEAVRTLTDDNDSGIVGRVFDSSAVLRVPPHLVHFWSPQLQLSVEADENGESRIHGLFGPHPTVWSFFVAIYVFAAFVGTMGFLFGAAQWTLDTTPTAFLAIPASVLLSFLVYGVGQTGRYLGREQVRALFESVQATIDHCESPAPADEPGAQPSSD